MKSTEIVCLIFFLVFVFRDVLQCLAPKTSNIEFYLTNFSVAVIDKRVLREIRIYNIWKCIGNSFSKFPNIVQNSISLKMTTFLHDIFKLVLKF